MNSSLRLLVIDDDELDRKAVVRALKQSAIALDICQAATAKEGLELASAQHFDAVLLDYRLPDQDGIAVLLALRSGKFESVAVLMLSGQEDDAIAEQCLEAGAQDFLLKDEVNGRRLCRAVRQAQQRYQMEQALRASHEQLRMLSERDALTGLANRRGFESALNSAIVRASHGQNGLAVLLLDLDDFKNVNDTLGHVVGDELLIEIARRLRLIVRDGDFLCRLGGDEFVVLAKYLDQDKNAALLAERLINAFQQPMVINSVELVITASIGIAVLDNKTENGSDLLKHADVAMYRAKREGRNQSRFYSEKLHNAAQQRSNLKRDLHSALERHELKLVFQAQIRSKDQGLGGMEVLLRWMHPQLGMLTPDLFISLAEESGMIVDIGDWVFEQACAQFADWRARYPVQCEGVTMSINLSIMQLHNENLLSHIEQTLFAHDIKAEHIELEITENALIEDNAGAVAALSALSAIGINLSLDDFGTGYSSMQHLQLFPIKVLKIDRAFISTIGKDASSDRLLIAIIRFAQALGLKIIAEGVETTAQANFCTENGCDLLQGCAYSRPASSEEFESCFMVGGRMATHADGYGSNYH